MSRPAATIKPVLGMPVALTTPRSRATFLERFMGHRAGVIGASVVLMITAAGALAPIIAPYDPIIGEIRIARQAPTAAHWLGTDELGRDILSRLLHATTLSMRVGLFAVAVGFGIGVPLGAMSAFLGGLTDLIVQRFIDTMQAFPGLLFAILVSAVAGPSLEITIAALGILSIPHYTRLVRGNVLLVKQLPYVEAARSIGCGQIRLIGLHVIPNSLSPVIVLSSLQYAGSILLLAGLGFLGLGAQPPAPEWGSMLSQGRGFLRTSPHMVIFPGILISLVVLSLNLVGDAFRDALDPRTTIKAKR